MKALEERILSEGKILPGPVLKVSSFLNHQMDPDLIMEIGAEIGDRFKEDKVTKILTIESSGIAIALAVGAALHVPVIFAKKHRTSNVSGAVYQTIVHSYTHNVDYTVVVESEFLKPDDNVLLVDDFLANGKALEGLMELVKQSGAKVAGAGIAIEKGFQDGSSNLKARGLRIESMAVIDSMDENGITFR